MELHSTPKFETTPEEVREYESLDIERIRNLADLVSDISELAGSLASNRQPDFSEHTFTYPIAEFSSLALPEVVQDRLLTRTLDYITVTVGSEDSLASYLSITLTDDDGMVYISRSGTGEGVEEQDVILDDRQNMIRINKISQQEINHLVMSLIRPNKTGDYSHTDDFNFLAPEQFENLTDTLEVSAPSVYATVEYSLDAPEGKISYFSQEKELTTVEVRYQSGKTGRIVIAQIDCQIGVGVTFYTEEYGERQKFIPDISDVIILREQILHELEKSKPVQEITHDLDQLPDESANPAELIG